MRLKDKVTVITGAGSGIGRASAIMFAKEGAKVVVADLEGPRGEDVAGVIRERGGRAIAVQMDVTKENDVRDLVEMTVREFGKLDVMFNNAGVGFDTSKFPTLDGVTEETWNRLIAVNLTGVFFGCKHAIPPMKANGGGSIIITSSSVAVLSTPRTTPYTAAKAGALGLMRNLAVDMGPFNIRVNAICPSGVGATNLNSPPGAPVVGEEERRRENERGSFDHIPLRRAAHPNLEEFAYAALFLASDESSYITGVTLPVDGGIVQARARPSA
jgi:NAD(P)-dependent dehydrogenase (short-subunit alcohol dehydrogenase family)